MRTQVLRRWQTHVWFTNADVMARWRQLYEAAPGKHTHSALMLLEETAQAAQLGEDSGGAATETPLLANRTNSLLIWKTLRRQRVPWESALALAEPQLASIPSVQRNFITKSVKGRPWDFSHAVLASWDVQDISLVPVYRQLKRCQTVVAMSQAVAAALRSRPELQQVLPVTVAVMRHCIVLGLTEERKDAAQLALSLLREHLALAGEDALPVSAREEIAVGVARLHARTGDWDSALRLVTSSSVVRLSVKESFSSYGRQREMFTEGGGLRREVVPTAIAHAPTWLDALAVLHAHTQEDEAKLAFLSRINASNPSESPGSSSSATPNNTHADDAQALSWQRQLSLFASVAPSKQTFRVLRPILARVPDTLPEYIVVCARALEPTAARMYAGTLTRRVHTLEKRGKVAAAVALCCAAGYFDVAAALVPKLPGKGVDAAPRAVANDLKDASEAACCGSYELPEELLLYSKTVAALTQPLEGLSECEDGGRVNSSSATYRRPSLSASATPPELLAHALFGDWRAVKKHLRGTEGRAPSSERLHSLVLARAREGQEVDSDGAGGEHGLCFSFASPSVTRLVCDNATVKDRRYFAKVIPRQLLAHHFGDNKGSPSSPNATTAASTDSGGSEFHRFVFTPSPDTVVRTLEDCHWLLHAILEHLWRHMGTGEASGADLLRAVARACATGQVRLRTSDAFGLALATLKASTLLGGDAAERKGSMVRVDSLVATAAVQATPAHYLDACAPAVAAGVNALLLTGNVRIVTAVYRRWARKEKEGTESIPALIRSLGAEDENHLANVFLRAAYYLSRGDAQKWAVRLWRDYRQPASLVLQELLVGDTRQAADMLRAHGHKRRKGASARSRGDGNTLRLPVSTAHSPLSPLGRRRLLGAAFCVLDTTPVLHFVVRAAGKSKITATDVDEHGLQRLLRALPGSAALTALDQLVWSQASPETVEELWLLLVLCKPDHEDTQEAARSIATLVAGSGCPAACLLVNSHCTLLLALSQEADRVNPGLALRAILRFTELSASLYKGSARVLYGVLSIMLKQLSECPAVVTHLLEAAREGVSLAELHKTSHRIVNRLLQQRDLEGLLRRERREMTQLLRRPEAVGPVLLLGWLHHVLSHHQRLPVAASFTSHLLRTAVEYTSDWRTAFYFFGCLRHPTHEERLLLLRSLKQHCTTDMTARVRQSRGLLRASPELVLVWAGMTPHSVPTLATGTDTASNNADFLKRIRLSEAVMRREMDAAAAATIESPGSCRASFHLCEETLALLRCWTVIDCERALGLLRYVGWQREEPTHGRRGPQGPHVDEDLGEEATVLKVVLEAIRQRQQHLANDLSMPK